MGRCSLGPMRYSSIGISTPRAPCLRFLTWRLHNKRRYLSPIVAISSGQCKMLTVLGECKRFCADEGTRVESNTDRKTRVRQI